MVYDILQAQSNMAEVEQAVRKCGSVIFGGRVLRSAGDGRCRNGHWALHVLLALELYQWDVLPALLGEPVAEAWLKLEDKRSDIRGIRTSLMRTMSVPAYVHGQLCFQHEWPKRLTSLPQYPGTTLLPTTAGQGVRTW
jgi:hypothetical protein